MIKSKTASLHFSSSLVSPFSIPLEAEFKYPTISSESFSILPKEIESFCNTLNSNIKVAVMGCAVNGPGEAREADIGIAGGNNEWLLFKKGEIIRKIPHENIINEFEKEILSII